MTRTDGRQRTQTATAPPYKSPFGTWSERSAVRSMQVANWFDDGPGGGLGGGPGGGPGEWLPQDDWSVASHPAVVGRGCRNRVAAALLLGYLDFTIQLESTCIGPVCTDIGLGRLGAAYCEDLVRDAFRVQCDEAFHSLLCEELARHVVAGTGLPRRRFGTHRFLARARELRQELAGRVDPVWFDFCTAVVAETVITKTLLKDWEEDGLRSGVRQLLLNHYRDEVRHCAYFTQALRIVWPQWPDSVREAITPCWSELILAFIGPDPDIALAALEMAGFPEHEARTIAAECQKHSEAAADQRASYAMTMNALRTIGVLPQVGAGGTHAHAEAERPAPFPLFRFGRGAGGNRVPLAVMGGGLILDSGEAEQTFVFRCQDRFLAYTSLYGLRSVFFVSDEDHARWYADRIEDLRARYAAIAGRCDVLPGNAIVEPLYVPCDIDTMRVHAGATFDRQIRDPAVLAPGATVEFCLNQISPSYAGLVARLDALLRERAVATDFDRDACGKAGELALRFHDKAHYVDLVRQAAGAETGGAAGLPPHADTAVVDPRDFLGLGSWDALVALYRARSGDAGAIDALYVKSSRDSSGNVSARLTRAGFARRAPLLKREIERFLLSEGIDWAERTAELRAEIALAPSLRHHRFSEARILAFKQRQAALRRGIGLLIQREIRRPEHSDHLFGGVGISYVIDGAGPAALIGVAAQVYQDADRQHYLGSLVSDEVEAAVLTPRLAGEMAELCRLFAETGYRGPINFDACLDRSGHYRLIYDCNPRLSAVFPALAVRAMLQRSGLEASSVLNLGYRGEFVCADPAAFAARLDEAGLLCTRERRWGVVVLPNLARDHGLDALVVNTGIAEVEPILDVLRTVATDASAAAQRLYY